MKKKLIFFIFYSYNLILASPKIISLSISYFIEDALFEFQNIDPNSTDNEHFRLKIVKTDTTLSIRLIPLVPFTLKKFNVQLQTPEYQKFFANGFQSWTLSKWYYPKEKVKKVGFPFGRLVKPYGDYSFWYSIADNKKNPRSHFFTILENSKQNRYFIASLNDDNAYTIIEKIHSEKIIVHKDVEGWEIQKPVDILQIYYQSNAQWNEIQGYFERLFPIKKQPPVTGWTSWYNYYTKINENIILENLEGFYHNRLPINYIQIDDGWQKKVGDWEPNGKFSKNLKDLTDDIHKRKYKAGLWFAPFIVEKKSTVYKERKDWLVYKPNKEKLLKVGFNPLWSGFFQPAFFALDIYHPEVQIYIRNIFKKAVNKWDFDLLKLDFLYAAALIPRNGKTRAMIMNDALKLLVAWKGNAKLLGCGVPFSSALRKFEYCRVGPDIGLNWDTKWMKKLKNLERISTMNAIHNTINRAILNGASLNNDPDVSILRNENNQLKKYQKITLFYVNHLLGTLNFISDNPSYWTDSILKIYQKIFPIQTLKIKDLNENKGLYSVNFQDEYILMVNMNKKNQTVLIEDSLIFECIQSKILKKGEKLTLKYGQTAFIRKVDTELDISFVGSEGYLLPGKEIEAIASDFENQSISISLNPEIKIRKLWIKIPQDWNECVINGVNAMVFVVNGVKIAYYSL